MHDILLRFEGGVGAASLAPRRYQARQLHHTADDYQRLYPAFLPVLYHPENQDARASP